MNRALKVILLSVAAGSFCLNSTGCKKEQQTADSPEVESRGTIALSVLTLTNPFFKTIGDSMADEAAKHGYEVIVVSGEMDPARQNNQVADFIVQKVSAIVLTPCDSEAIGQSVKQANEVGIPVFTADIACTAKGAKVVSHVATNNYEGGKQAAEGMMRALDNKGKVAILTHPTVESAQLRCKGFKDELVAKNSEIEIVGTWAGMGDRDESFKATQEILQVHPDLAAFFCVNDPSALGTYAAIEKANKTKQIKIIGFDGQLEGKKAIKAGKIFADPIQFPDRIGRKTVQTIVSYFEGNEVEPEILIAPELYYKADAEKDPELKED